MKWNMGDYQGHYEAVAEQLGTAKQAIEIALAYQTADAQAALCEARLADAQANLKVHARQNEQLINERDALMQWGFDWQTRAHAFGAELHTYTFLTKKGEEAKLLRDHKELLESQKAGLAQLEVARAQIAHLEAERAKLQEQL